MPLSTRRPLSCHTCSSVISQDPRGSERGVCGGCTGVSFLETCLLEIGIPLLMKGAFVSWRAGADVSFSWGQTQAAFI